VYSSLDNAKEIAMRMRQVSVSLVLPLLLGGTAAWAEDSHSHTMHVFARVQEAIDSGDVVPERDLAPAIELLREVKDQDERARVVDDIEELGRADGASPAAVKRYILDQATPILVEIANDTHNGHFLRGSAITALRDMGAPRDVLQRVADMAQKDADEYVQSRGEILQNYIATTPAASQMANIKPKDSAKEQKAIAFLKSHDLDVSLDQLRRSAIGAEPDEVSALLDAGVDPNGGDPNETPLGSLFGACPEAGETEAIVKTLDVLIAGGADVKRRDDNANTPLLRAAQYCGSQVVLHLIAAGAEVNAKTATGITPLVMALISDHLDAADVLVNKGARMTHEQVVMVSAMATSPRAKAIVKKATKK
jgi:hypothetical protein